MRKEILLDWKEVQSLSTLKKMANVSNEELKERAEEIEKKISIKQRALQRQPLALSEYVKMKKSIEIFLERL